mmetsp:Transcript_8195/g.22729  ORF Transcript_8195/g.22729 Transcript_8195/m.22729 type:complete len:144 (-) Transcript_8195:1897-2328(-)
MAWRSSGTTNDEMVDNLKRKCRDKPYPFVIFTEQKAEGGVSVGFLASALTQRAVHGNGQVYHIHHDMPRSLGAKGIDSLERSFQQLVALTTFGPEGIRNSPPFQVPGYTNSCSKPTFPSTLGNASPRGAWKKTRPPASSKPRF